MSENVYRYVRGLAEKRFGDSNLSPLQLLYGYAYTASINDLTLSMYFRDDSDRRDLIAIRRLFDENLMDLSLIKIAVPELEKGKLPEDVLQMSKNAERSAREKEGSVSVNVLKHLLELPLPEISFFKKGNDLQTVFSGEDVSFGGVNTGNGGDAHRIINTVSSSGLDALKRNISRPDQGASISSGEPALGVRYVFRKKSERAGRSFSDGKGLSGLVSRCTQLGEYLNEKMPGQNKAVHLFVRNYFRSRLSANEKTGRTTGGVMLLAGASEDEQVRMVSLAAKFLAAEVVRLEDPQEMWGLIEQSPELFVLVEEFETLEPERLSFISRVLSEGLSAFNVISGGTVDYRQVIFVFTTGVCSRISEDENKNSSHDDASGIIRALKDIFEKRYLEGDMRQGTRFAINGLLGSFNSQNIIPFENPDIRFRLSAIKRGITLCEAALSEEYGLSIKADEALSSFILYSSINAEKWDTVLSMSRQIIEDELYEVGRHLGTSLNNLDELNEVRIVVDTDELDDASKGLFEDKENYTVLYIGDEKDILNVNLPDRINLLACGDMDSAMKEAAEENVRFALIDITYGQAGDQEYLSIDDRGSIGMSIFEEISRGIPSLPLYIAEKEKLEKHDRDVMIEAGAADFVPMQDDAQISDTLMRTGNMLYLQKKTDEFKSQGLTLKYNTSQKISLSEKYAQIRFYDLRIHRPEG